MNRPVLPILVLALLTISLSGFSQHEICFTPSSFGDFSYTESIDFDADGFPDLAAINSQTTVLQILKGKGDGTFEDAVSYTVGTSPTRIALGDFDNDSEIDLAVMNNGSHSVSILLGNGDATFQTAITVEANSGPTSMVIFDADEDSNSDLLVSNFSGVIVLLGNGDGTFTGNGGISFPYKITAGDFNGDGHFDIAGVNPTYTGSPLKIALGNGTGAFTVTAQTYQTPSTSFELISGDFNHDNKTDLVTTTYYNVVSINVFLGNGDGTFANGVTYPTIGLPKALTMTDFNTDGDYDIVVGSDNGQIEFLAGDGTGTFTKAYLFTGGGTANSIEMADYNEDGLADVSTGARIYLSSLPLAKPTLSTTQPNCTKATGYISISPSATGNTYSFDDGQTYGVFSVALEAAPGDYKIRYTNAAGCVSLHETVTINQPPAVPAKPAVQITQPTCSNSSLITVTKQNDTDTYRYGSSGSFETSNMKLGYAGSNTTITIKNAAGCTSVSDSFTLNYPPAAPDLPQVNVIQPSCTAAASITIQNGQTNDLFSFNDGESYEASKQKTNLELGTYKIRIKNSSGGCASQPKEVIINASTTAPPKPEVIVVQATCTTDATITITKQNDTDVYSFDSGEFVSTNVKSNAKAGSYSVVVKNAGGCVSYETVTVNEYPVRPSSPTLQITQPSCSQATGSVLINFQLNVTAYSFDGGDTFQDVNSKSGLTSGDYNISVKGTSGCVATAKATINVQPITPSKPIITVNKETGEMQATSSGAVSYKWFLNGNLSSNTTASFANPENGSYTVTAVSDGGCTSSSSDAYLITGLFETNTGNGIVFPNPSRDYIYLRAEQGANWYIVSTKGEQAFSGKVTTDQTTTIDVRDLSSGVYFVRLISGRQVQIARFVKL